MKEAARDVGGITDFDEQYASALHEVRNDAGMGVMLGVKSTPTFFINGHKSRPAVRMPRGLYRRGHRCRVWKLDRNAK